MWQKLSAVGNETQWKANFIRNSWIQLKYITYLHVHVFWNMVEILCYGICISSVFFCTGWIHAHIQIRRALTDGSKFGYASNLKLIIIVDWLFRKVKVEPLKQELMVWAGLNLWRWVRVTVIVLAFNFDLDIPIECARSPIVAFCCNRQFFSFNYMYRADKFLSHWFQPGLSCYV